MKSIFIFFVIFVLFLGCESRKNNTNNGSLNNDEGQKTEVIEQIPLIPMEETLEDDNVFQYNYADGNGTILKIEYIDHLRWIYRKHEQIIPNEHGKLSVLDRPDGTEIFLLDEKIINIFELALEENSFNKKIWLKIKNDEEKEGWICGYGSDPYSDGSGASIEIINTANKNWTVIKLPNQKLYAVNGLNVRDKPGLIDTKVLFQFNYNGEQFSFEYYDDMRVDVLAMTKEKDTVDDESLQLWDRTYSWIKIRARNGLEGWVFGGYLDVWVRGGAPKIVTPEDIVSFMFMNY